MIKYKATVSVLLLSLIVSACGGGGGGSDDTDQANSQESSRADDQDGSSSEDGEMVLDANGRWVWKKRTTSTPTTPTTPTSPTSPTSPTAPTTPTTSTGLSYQQLFDDMNKPHEAFAHGVNPDWGWGTNPRPGVGTNFHDFPDPHLTPWGVVASAQSGNPATNTRVQIRKMTLDVKRNGVWTRIANFTNQNQIDGSLYTSYEKNTTAAANNRLHGADGISVKLPNSGGSYHFVTSSRFPTAHGAQEIVFTYEARLIVDNTSLADDRSKARILANSGGDVWRSASQLWNGNNSNYDIAIGRFKFVKNEWSTFSSHTLATSGEINDYLAKAASLQ